eukprot:TRINITY_DN20707_c0_g1_i3.p2 TRINITY_DN20707_c0_g1~~TRINITY_DN20707_c0_g1_i3.p2  ORF type:complete len:113 (-),score=33.58 TRINITY_DN20707_c0_g1_i3:67-405(-)
MATQAELAELVLTNAVDDLRQRLNEHPDLVDRRVKQAGDGTLLIFACYHGKIGIVRELLGRQPDLITQDNEGRAALHTACERGPVSYTHLRAHETPEHLVCRLLLEKKKNKI